MVNNCFNKSFVVFPKERSFSVLKCFYCNFISISELSYGLIKYKETILEYYSSEIHTQELTIVYLLISSS